jgi:hypothetical protein
MCTLGSLFRDTDSAGWVSAISWITSFWRYISLFIGCFRPAAVFVHLWSFPNREFFYVVNSGYCDAIWILSSSSLRFQCIR